MQAAKAAFQTYRAVLVAAALLVVATSSAGAGTWAAVAPGAAVPEPARVVVSWYDQAGLDLTVDVSGLELGNQKTPGGEFVWARWPEAAMAGETGQPALPVVRRLFVVPNGATVELTFAHGEATSVDLESAGFGQPIIPMQAPLAMPLDATEVMPFDLDGAAYAGGDFLPAERVTITKMGMVRGQYLYLLEVRPVAYDPACAELRVWAHFDVSIRFGGEYDNDTGLRPLRALNSAVLNPTPVPLGDRASGNYLIVVASAYATSLPTVQFANTKAAQGFNVMTYEVPAGTSNTTIKSYIQSLWGTANAPDYILIIGDTDKIPHWTGGGDSHAVTDLPYACMDGSGDWYPDIYIGRFSVRSETELQAVVDKSLYVEAGDFPDPEYVKRAAFLATNDVASGSETTHDWVIENYMDPAEFESIKIYERLGGNTQQVKNAVNYGCLYTTYFGHSNSGGWWGPDFDQNDVRSLSNSGLYGLAFGFSCNTAHFDYTECFGETWIRETDKGSAAYLSASTYIYWTSYPWDESTYLEQHFFESIFAEDIHEVSPAWQAALYDFLGAYGASNPACRDYFEMMVLLGDPALHLPEGIGFALTVDPTSQSVCSPPTDEAVYTINVESFLGFSEPVTLSAAGLPLGATVSFSVNSLPPPFTSEMTIGNLTISPPGHYTIQITGTAASMQRTEAAGLSISSDVPGAVTLIEPPDGAEEVSHTPTLVWNAASQAADYDIEIATDASFTNVVYSATEPDTSHTVATNLETSTTHYWHVRANNGCGESDFSTPFSFTTMEQPDYFTELFTSGFDLEYLTVRFRPDGSGDFYEVCRQEATEFPTDPSGGTALYPGEDSYVHVFLAYSRTVELYGLGHTNFYVGSNGYITFGGGDGEYTESLSHHFAMPRISSLFDDLSPQYGEVSWKQTDDRAAVTFQDVPEWNTGNQNSFQIEMFFDGDIRITWLRVDSNDSIVGLSAGLGQPGDFVESDLSESDPCPPDCPGDLDGDLDIDLADLSILLSNYGLTSGATYEQGDIDLDGDVDLADLGALLSVYGETCD